MYSTIAAGLGEHSVAVADDRGSAKRVERLHRRWRCPSRLALKRLQLVFEPELLHEPYDALGAGAREVIDGNHFDAPWPSTPKAAAGRRAASGENDLARSPPQECECNHANKQGEERERQFLQSRYRNSGRTRRWR